MKCKLIAAGVLALAGITAGYAQDFDYPDFYIRGAMCDPLWGVQDNLKFQRENDVYHLTIPGLVGQFKISNADWTINYGGEYTQTVSGNTTINCIQDGTNLTADYNQEVTISFIYDGATKTPILFSLDGEIIKHGEVSLTSGSLPVLYVNVYNESGELDNEIISKDLDHKNYFSGEYWFDTNGCTWIEGAADLGSAEEPLPLEIKARGNWTRRGFSKKPFKLKLGKKQSMLGMTKSKHYAILAHADDSFGYMRNFVGFNLGKRIGLPWTPSQQPIEVVINGDYRGLYFLTESIRVGDDRIMIESLDDNVSDAALVSGGYLIELDNYDEENQIQMEEKGNGSGYKDMLRITFDTPEIYSDLQKRFVTDQFTAMNDFVGENSDDLWSYLDLDDAARYYIVEELISHVESYHGSTYMFRDRGEGQKWHFSPLWDCGNAFVGPTNDFFYNHAPYGCTWISSFRLNGMFNEKVKETWKWFMSNRYEGLQEDIESYCESLKKGAEYDHKRWHNQPVPDGGMPVVDNRDMDNRRNTVVNHIESKVNWLIGEFGDYRNGTYTEPERDATPAAPLPEYAKGSTAVYVIDAPTAGCEYYDMQGMRVANPVKGEPYIVVKEGKATKRMF